MSVVPITSSSTLPASRSPERAALADAITRYAGAKKIASEARLALQNAEGAKRNAARQVEAAEAAIETARRDETAFAVASARGRAGDPPLGVKRAKAHLEEAQDVLVICTAALAELAQGEKSAGHSLSNSQDRLQRALAGVLMVESFPLLIRAYEDARRQAAELALCLMAIGDRGGIPPEHHAVWKDRVVLPAKSELVERWKTALGALERNADAALPTI